MKVEKGKAYFYAKEDKIWTCIDAIDGEGNQSSFLSKDGQDAKFYNHDMYEKRYMKTYTKEEHRRNLEGACKALEENTKKAVRVMRNSKGGRCCLAVMEDYAKSIDEQIKIGLGNFPHGDLSDFYGLKNMYESSDMFNFNFKNGDAASFCNDGSIQYGIKEHTHKEIAARIREDFLA